MELSRCDLPGIQEVNMNIELIGRFVPLFQTLAWILLVVVVLISMRKHIRILLDKLCGADELEMSLGSLTVQARTMRELHQSIGLGFPEEMINKAEIDALLNIKLKGIQAAMERTVSQGDARYENRIGANEPIKISRENGETIGGTTIDVSEAGIGFKSEQRLRFSEVVTIVPSDPKKELSGPIKDPVRIVRIEESKEGYHYGAALSR